MKCDECGQEVTDRVAIGQLEKRVRQLENDLLLERMRPKEIQTYPYPVPQPMRQPWLDGPIWISHSTGTLLPHADYVTCGGVGGGSIAKC